MSHEAKREAIGIARSIKRGEYQLPAIDEVNAANKPLRYGLLRSPISWAIDRLDTSPQEQRSIVQSARSLHDLRLSLLSRVDDLLEQAVHDYSLKSTLELIDFMQDQLAQSRDSHHKTALEVMSAGAATYVDASEAIFTVIEKHYGTAVAALPEHASILSKTAQLGVTQSTAFAFSYVSQKTEFKQLIEKVPGGGIKLKIGWKEQAYVSKKFQDEYYALTNADRQARDIPISSIEDEPIGCPVAFNYEEVCKLWNFYAQTRRKFTRQQFLAGKSLELTSDEKITLLLEGLAKSRQSSEYN